MADSLGQLTAALSDRYTIERELGAGGMATVYLAQDLKHDRKVAIKVLRPELAAVLGADRFLNEIRVTANLQHPHILPLFDSGEADSFVYYVMPYVEGESLRDTLRREGTLSVTDTARVMSQVADALSHAHERGVLHRDIKPDNVMVSGRHATVMDFGVARAVTEATDEHGLTTAGMAVGTPAYMAPEQAAAATDVDHRVDIYALGILGYELLTGSTPFEGRAPHQILAAHVTEDPDHVTSRQPSVPTALAQVVMRCLEKEIDERWSSGEEIVQRLDNLDDATVAVPRTSRLTRWAAPAVAAFVVVAFLWQWMGTNADGAASSSNSIVVFPFAFRGSGDLEYWGEGMVRLLSSSLDGAGDLRKVDPNAVHGAVDRLDAVLDPTSATGIARDLDARWFVLGEIVEVGEELNVSATLYDAAGDGSPVGEATAMAAPDASMVDGVATQLLASGGFPGSGVTPIAEVTTASMPALKAYLEGEALFRAGEFLEAIAVLEEAVAIDTQFAAAYYRLSEAANWAVVPEVAERAAAAAVRHSARLSDHDRRMLEALGAFRRGEFDHAERMYREVTQIWPQDVEAWVQLGEIQFHSGPLLGSPVVNSRQAFDRVLDIDPENLLAMVHLQRVAAASSEGEGMDSLGRAILGLLPTGDRSFEAEMYRAIGLQDSVVLDSVFTRLDSLPDRDLAVTLAVLMYGDGFREGERILEAHIRADRAPEVRAVGHAVRAHWLATHGRWEAAWGELEKSEALDRSLGLTHHAFFTLHPMATPSRADLESLRTALDDWDAEGVPPSRFAPAHYSIHNGRYPIIRSYLRGLVAARLGDTEGARAAQADVRRATVPEARPYAEVYALSIEAQLALQRGDTVGALVAIEQQPPFGDYQPAMYSPVTGRSMDRYRRAQLLEALGRDDEARKWYSSFEGFSYVDRVFAAPAHLQLGKIAERAGRFADARSHFERVLFLWGEADPALQSVVEEAREGLRRVG